MGYACHKLGDYERSLAHYHKALLLNPCHRGALEYLGETYLAMGRPERARKILQRLLRTWGRLTGKGIMETQEPDSAHLIFCQHRLDRKEILSWNKTLATGSR